MVARHGIPGAVAPAGSGHRLDPLLVPGSIALVGASVVTSKFMHKQQGRAAARFLVIKLLLIVCADVRHGLIMNK